MCVPALTGVRNDLLKVLNHIRRFKNHSAYLRVHALAFQQLVGVSERMRIDEVDRETVVPPVQRSLPLWRRKVANIYVMIVRPPGRMTASPVADHLGMWINKSEVRMPLQYAVRLS